MKSIAAFLLFWLVMPSTALAMTIGYDIKIQNHLVVPIIIEVTQYHSEAFNGTPPKSFTDDLKISKRVISLQAKENQSVHYNSASGGFWLLWKQLEPTTNTLSSGVINLGEGDRAIDIK